MWNRAKGVELWVNGKKAASTMGTDTWWENQRPGLFHLPMAKAAYDELYIFSRTLTEKEIGDLHKNNRTPSNDAATGAVNAGDIERMKKAFTSDTASLPVARPSSGPALVFRELTPERIHDEGIQGWWIADGRYELAWPHEYSVFTIIPGDVDFHAEKADILPPKAASVNYMTFEGNLDGVEVLKGDRNGHFDSSPAVMVPRTTGFFYGATVDGLGNSELRIPLTKSYGAPPGFKSDDGALRLPLSGDLRLHEVGIFNVREDALPLKPGHRTMYVNPRPMNLDGKRYPAALEALFCSRDKNTAGIYKTFSGGKASTVEIAPMSRLQLLSEAVVGKYAFDTVIADLWVTSPTEGNVVQFRLYDPAVPSHTWTHAEVKLAGFTGKPSRLRVALEFDSAFLVSGDRVWLEIMTTDGLSILTGDPERRSQVILLPDVDWTRAEESYAIKTLRPTILTYGRSFEYIPWEWDKQLPDVDTPTTFGGMFDMAYPWQAVLKVNPGDKVANIYRAYTTGDYSRGRYPSNMDNIFGYEVQSRQFDRYPGDSGLTVAGRTFPAPANAPGWAVFFRELQTFRQQIVTWWRHHQRSDGQAGGGWNDDTLIFSRAFGDMPLDSNKDALALYNNVFDGFDKTNYFKDGYCRIYPIDRLHNGDFVRERYKSLIYNLGDPRSAVWAMEEAWHWDKEDQTPVNYGDGKAFLFGKDVLEWYWGRQKVGRPYRLENPDKLADTLLKAAVVNNDTTLWRFTEAWCHTDDQAQYGSGEMLNMLLGGWGSSPRRDSDDYYKRNVTITIGVGWIEGGGPQLGRRVDYSGNDGLKVSMYSFDRFERKVAARLFRLDPGTYGVTLKADRNGDGSYEETVSENEKRFRRFDKLEMSIPSRVPLLLEVTQIKADQSPGDRPDLAVDAGRMVLKGDTLTIPVYNIGSAPSGRFTVTVICPGGSALKTVEADSLPGSADFVPKKVDITVPGLPAKSAYHIYVDRDDAIAEIFEENNNAVILSGTF